MAEDRASLTFWGGAGCVTGSKYQVEVNGSSVLLDAGLFQGLKKFRLRNWEKPPFDPSRINAVILSHAHIDHSGYLPALFKNHFRGKVYCTPGTADLLDVLLLDSADLQEEEAERANRKGYSKHKPALPLYTLEDADLALNHVKHYPYGRLFEAAHGIHCRFHRAGHILGSALVELEVGRKRKTRVVFSGDLGRWNRPIIRDPEFVPEADILLVESTYGDRMHATGERENLARIVNEAAARGGALIIPAFALGRTQELMWTLRRLEDEKKIPILPVYVDSPMAKAVTDIYCSHPEDHDLDLELLKEGQPPLLYPHQCRFTRSPEESKALNKIEEPVIIISASGMATGGRVLHHLRARLPDPRTTVLLCGYQAAGTRGRALLEGVRSLRIYGQEVPVKARIDELDGLSAHADRGEVMKWLSGFKKPPAQTYVVHGEPEASLSMAEEIRRTLGWNVRPAKDGETVPLLDAACVSNAQF